MLSLIKLLFNITITKLGYDLNGSSTYLVLLQTVSMAELSDF